jgi:thiamine-monophosphate kinase
MKEEQEQTGRVSGADRLSQKTEFDFINSLKQRFASVSTNQSLACGIGDDAAVFRSGPGKETVITADLLVEDIDFRRHTTPPYLLGHKALAVSLSDIAAMGSRPLWSMVSVGVPEEVWQTDFVDRLYDGLLDLANRYGVRLIGGDTSRTPENIVIDSIVTGECAAGTAVMRSGARAGDQIFVSNVLITSFSYRETEKSKFSATRF